VVRKSKAAYWRNCKLSTLPCLDRIELRQVSHAKPNLQNKNWIESDLITVVLDTFGGFGGRFAPRAVLASILIGTGEQFRRCEEVQARLDRALTRRRLVTHGQRAKTLRYPFAAHFLYCNSGSCGRISFARSANFYNRILFPLN